MRYQIAATRQNVAYLADGLHSADDAEKYEDPSEQQTESEVPLDDVCVHVYAFRESQHFMPTSSHAAITV